MKLTEDERAALERFRTPIDPLGVGPMEMEQRRRDAFAVAHAMTRLFPVRTYGDLVIRWDDEITTERLVACGFKVEQGLPWIANGTYQLTLYPSGLWEATHLPFCIHEKVYPTPRNMLDIWQLMERCGIEEGGK